MLLYNQFKGNNKIKKNKSEGEQNMKKEIKVENKNGYVASYLTETNEFLHKKDCGWIC